MTSLEALQQHQKICDELYELALAENRHLQQHRGTPGPDLIERKKQLLARLDAALAALRTPPTGESRASEMRAALDKARSRVLQILQLDRENEQLLIRYSLSRGAPAPASAAPAPPASMLQKIYSRHS
ncbi:MAG TPA: hypothetical protein VHV47_13005 [Opitutaceae bacterium]|jgi:hypothetical protein|nr:hypothetical protein [Opitutaceae bacterium]